METTNRPRFHRRAVGVALAVLALELAGCGGGAPRGPEVPAPQAAGVLAAFSGTWRLVPEESTGPARIVRDGRQRGGGGTGFLPPTGGGGGRGGIGGGRGIPGGGGGGGGGGFGGGGAIGRRGGGGGRPIPARGADAEPDPLAPLNLAPAFDLTVTDSTLTFAPHPVEPDSTAAQPRVWPRPRPPVAYELHLDGKEADGPGRAQVTARWSGRSISVERKVEDGPELKEQWSVDDATGHLVVTREIALPRGPKVDQRQVYRRVEAPDTGR